MTRYYCEFKECNCVEFKSKRKICDKCKHANIWHSKKNKYYPKYDESQFFSSRKKARQPKYVNDLLFPLIFVPKNIPIVEAVAIDPTGFCQEVYALPV